MPQQTVTILDIEQHGDSAEVTYKRADIRQMDLSARAYHCVLKLSRTIADLAGEEAIPAQHLTEALQYRPRTVV